MTVLPTVKLRDGADLAIAAVYHAPRAGPDSLGILGIWLTIHRQYAGLPTQPLAWGRKGPTSGRGGDRSGPLGEISNAWWCPGRIACVLRAALVAGGGCPRRPRALRMFGHQQSAQRSARRQPDAAASGAASAAERDRCGPGQGRADPAIERRWQRRSGRPVDAQRGRA